MNREHWAAALAAILVGASDAPKHISYREIRGEGKPIKGGPRVGRNDKCPCGSGQKFKNCHLRDPRAAYVDIARIGESVVAGATRERSFLNVVGATTHRTACGEVADADTSDRGCPPS